MKDSHRQRTIKNLLPILFFLIACLLVFVSNPFAWIFGDPLFVEYCHLKVENQSGKTLRLTPINSEENSYSHARIYHTAFPASPAYQQSNISVNQNEQISFAFDCSERISKLYICDLEDECYLSKPVYQQTTIQSLDLLDRPDAALQAAAASYPEHDYRLRIDMLLFFISITALLGGFYWLKRTKPAEMPPDF